MALVHVAVAVILKGDKVLISRRPDHVHQGGLWEFPGGKVEHEETVQYALKRELKEELGIDIDLNKGITPLMRIRHDYGDKVVLLDVWTVCSFKGQAEGIEGQPIEWVSKLSLTEFRFPEANKPIIVAINLPQKYLVTGAFKSPEDCLNRAKRAITEHGIRIIQFRCHELLLSDPGGFIRLARDLKRLCDQYNVKYIVNSDPELWVSLDADGLHMAFSEAVKYSSRPVPVDILLGVSCHSAEELMLVNELNPDYVTLSPVNKTKTHPEAKTLGWSAFRKLTDEVACPVFALGGMTDNDLNDALSYGAQGIAGISEWW